MSVVDKMEVLDQQKADAMDRRFRGALAQLSKGMSPLEISMATFDWIAHLAISPGRKLRLAQSFASKAAKLGVYGIESIFNKEAIGPASAIEARMSSEQWQRWPFKVLAQAHQTSKDWWNEATTDVEGVKPENELLVQFVINQVLDLLAPANNPLTNPDVIKATIDERGKNILRGAKFAASDVVKKITKKPLFEQDSDYQVGVDVAVTSGKVVYRNDLIEVMQYDAVTDEVCAEPVLICPAWIMKYYILDLSPRNSLIKYLVDQGKTVFAISWKNPSEEDKCVGFEDYVDEGLMAAINAVSGIVPDQKIHAVGYCIGGTLTSITAAQMAKADDDRLASISLFAAQTDFSEAGEITRFVSYSQLSFLEKIMEKRGYLGSENMGGAFAALRSSDLIYSALVQRYLMGELPPSNDLMSWNADGTRMPYKMHHEYLDKLYLKNEFSTNRFKLKGEVVSMSDVHTPMFVLGTETDHVAPWPSVYKVHNLTNTELTFVLTSGGHNAGVISGPQHPRRRFRAHTRLPGDKYIDCDKWKASFEPEQGSWWPYFSQWLDDHSSAKVPARPVGAPQAGYEPLCDAPGEYVFM